MSRGVVETVHAIQAPRRERSLKAPPTHQTRSKVLNLKPIHLLFWLSCFTHGEAFFVPIIFSHPPHLYDCQLSRLASLFYLPRAKWNTWSAVWIRSNNKRTEGQRKIGKSYARVWAQKTIKRINASFFPSSSSIRLFNTIMFRHSSCSRELVRLEAPLFSDSRRDKHFLQKPSFAFRWAKKTFVLRVVASLARVGSLSGKRNKTLVTPLKQTIARLKCKIFGEGRGMVREFWHWWGGW